MSERLAHLRRQRALAQEQLEWFNREIARAEASETAKSEPPASSANPPPRDLFRAASVKPIDPTSPTATTAPSEDDIIAQYRVGPDSLKNDVRKGCLIYFAAALLLLAGGVAILFFSLGRR